MKLSDLEIGESGIVTEIKVAKKAKVGLQYVGLTKGVKVTIIRVAPFSDPIEIKLRDFCLAIRRDDANLISVEKV